MSTSSSSSRPSGPSSSEPSVQSESSTKGTTPGESSSGGGDEGSTGGGKRRRAPKFVTPNACTNCKKAKSKCDGLKPSCTRCRNRKTESLCRYEVHVNTAKEEMVREMKELREKNDWVERILRALRSDSDAQDIIERLRNGDSYKNIAGRLRRGALGNIVRESPVAERQLSDAFIDLEMNAASDGTLGQDLYLPDDARWTNVTTDDDLVDHLLALYFTWLHPIHLIFSETHFMASYRNRSNIYCSVPLVNAICAMGCRFFEFAPEYDTEPRINPGLMGEKFMAEARSHIKPDIYYKMSTLQTFAIMFLVDLSAGRGARASSYLRIAADRLNSKLDSQHNTETAEIASWGLYVINILWAANTYQVPSLSRMPTSEIFHNVHMDWHDDLWHFYRHTGNFDESPQPNSAMTTAKEHAKFSRIVHDTVAVFYDGQTQLLTARVVLQLYKRYMTWREELPDKVASSDGSTQPPPHVLYLHIQYHAAIVKLFRPFIEVDHIHSSIHDRVREIAVDNALRGLEILDTYRRLYTCRYQLPFQCFSLLQMCDLLIRFSPAQPPATDVVHFCLEVLKECADGPGGFSICGPLQEMFRQSAIECNVSLPEDLLTLMGPPSQYSPDDMLDAYTRLSYVQPVGQITDHLDPTFVPDFMTEWENLFPTAPSPGKEDSPSSERSMQISWLLN